MDANRFFSVSYDASTNPKVLLLEELQGDGMAAFGRWIALLSLLYDNGGAVMLDNRAMAAVAARKLGYDDPQDAVAFLDDCAEAGLIDASAWSGRSTVTSRSVSEEIAYRRKRVETGKMGGRPRKKKVDVSKTKKVDVS